MGKHDKSSMGEKFATERRRRRSWKTVVIALSCAVVIGTVGALTLPAITMSGTTCQQEEHQHTDECYTEGEVLSCTAESLGLHQHTDACFNANGDVICHYADFVVHKHDALCYDGDKLVCTLPEIEEHQHDDSCYDTAEDEIIDEGHTHDDSCYAWSTGDTLICNQEESAGHTHTDSCRDEAGALICGEEESAGHTHDDSCYNQVRGELICTEEEREPVTEPGEQVLICDKPEVELHTHKWGTAGYGCYMDAGVRQWHCDKLEVKAHQHTADCFTTGKVLTCGKTEHTHDDSCMADDEADLETAEDWEKLLPEAEELTGQWSEDLLLVAKSQLGYQESKRNYIVDEDGSRHGYTRYGAWADDPYADWDALYVAFSLHYAGVPEEAIPDSADPDDWVEAYRDQEAYRSAEEEYTPVPGDLVFFDYPEEDGNPDGTADHVAIFLELRTDPQTGATSLVTLEGDADGTVDKREYPLPCDQIMGYGDLSASRADYDRHHPPKPSTPLEAAGDGYTMRVSADAGVLPEKTRLNATSIDPSSEAYAAYVASIQEALEMENITVWMYDVSFSADDAPVEPSGSVNVEMKFNPGLDAGDGTCFLAVHFLEDGTLELLPVEVQWTEDQSAIAGFTHSQDSFSPLAYVALGKFDNPTEIGPNYLPVTYYISIDNEWVPVGSTKTGWYGDLNAGGYYTNTNRDHVTLEQVESVLGPYGFRASGTTDAVNCQLYYQRKEIRANTNCYNDTDAYQENGYWFYPISRNSRPTAGYNIYYAPGKTTGDGGHFNNADLLQAGVPVESKFFSIKVFDEAGALLHSEVTRAGGSFSYDASASGITYWLVGYEGGDAQTYSGSVINLSNIRTTVVVSPMPSGNVKNKTVTFKVMVDGKWETVGKMPYYFTGSVNGAQRAYITSTMAAQFLGDYGYTPTMDPGYHFGYSYDDIYNILYSTNTNFAIDISGGNIAQDGVVQLYTSNNSAAQTFRIWEADSDYCFITPLSNSGLHINVFGGGTGNGKNLRLRTETDAASQWRLKWEADGRVTFWTRQDPDNYCIDLDSGNTANGTKVQLWNKGDNRFWRLRQVYRISNQTVSQQNADGTYNIGLTAESNGDIVCYYLPAEISGNITNRTESEISTNNTYWSVSVRDDNQLIYDVAQAAAKRVIVPDGGSATITVDTYEDVLWGSGGQKVEPVENEDGTLTFTFTNIRQTIEVQASPVNAMFTVQYYSNIPKYVMESNTPADKTDYIDIIDTTGGKLPQNTSVTRANGRGSAITNPNQPLKWLALENTGWGHSENRGDQTTLYRVKTTEVLTELLTPEEYNFWEQPGLTYVDKLEGSTGYKLTYVGVLRDGAASDSVEVNDWWWYMVNDDRSNITFTNIALEENAPRELDANGDGIWQTPDKDYCILIKQGTVLVMWYTPRVSQYTNKTTFYDYDITSGHNNEWRWYSGVTGINSHSNYMASRNGVRDWSAMAAGGEPRKNNADVFAFGNQNCETGMGGAQWDGNAINSYNGGTLEGSGESKGKDVYAGCTFGMVTGLDNGKLRWTDWITAPRMFNEGGATGKYTYDGGTLTFNRVGDLYTLTAANSTVGSRSNLEYFFQPSPTNGTIHRSIHTNNFWPMDGATNKTDPLFGAWGNAANGGASVSDTQVNGFYDDLQQVGGNRDNYNLPLSDDGRAHNWFFGMNFSLEFTLTADYIGPLEYVFFGDDDMWVFLDNQLICDIGGVHSSVGEYVNLWDYVQKGDTKTHTLTFFYTERGASGSTCWMGFILPSVSAKPVSRRVGGLQISKTVKDGSGEFIQPDETYKFRVDLKQGENDDTDLKGYYSYTKTKSNGKKESGIVKAGGTITMNANETITIEGLPHGAYYRITELTTAGYMTSVNGNAGYILGGTIQEGVITPAKYVNQVYAVLPETGGPGTNMYIISGSVLMFTVALIYSSTRKKRKGVK